MNIVMNASGLSEKKNDFPLKKIMKAVFIGIGGNLILIVFFMTFLQIFEAIKFMPWIIAFNTAHTGFSLVDKAGNHPFYIKLTSVTAGLATVLITVGIFAVLAVFLFGDLFLQFRDFGVFILIGVVCSLLGTFLAVKYYSSNRK